MKFLAIILVTLVALSSCAGTRTNVLSGTIRVVCRSDKDAVLMDQSGKHADIYIGKQPFASKIIYLYKVGDTVNFSNNTVRVVN